MSAALRLGDYYVTEDEYLAAEELSEVRHEYLAGAVYAMAGASRPHNRIAGNINRNLGNQLSGKRCEAFSTDLKLRIRKAPHLTFYYYPGVVVDCSGSDSNFVEAPTVVFEILSEGTARTDRGEKLTNYQSLSSLKVYVIVDQFRAAVTVHRRDAETWTMEWYSRLEEVIELPEIGCSLTLAAIYERMGF